MSVKGRILIRQDRRFLKSSFEALQLTSPGIPSSWLIFTSLFIETHSCLLCRWFRIVIKEIEVV